MTIAQLAERSGVPASTLRYYDGQGLLPARRTPAGYRTYAPSDLQRLRFIGTAKRLGLSLDDVAELLDVWQDGACAQVKASLRPRVAEQLAAAQGEAGRLAAFAETLRGALDHLDALPDNPSPCGPECGLLDLDSRATQRIELPRTEDGPHAPAIACSLDGASLGDRVEQWSSVLDGARREEIPGGLRAVLSADRAAEVAELAAAEQGCCPFYSFTLHFDHGTIQLEVQAPESARGMLDGVFSAS